jgi:hypothetical protein
MTKLRSGRPSPAMVLAALALVFAMVGTAVAGPDGVSNKITKSKVKKIAKKQAKKQLKANVDGSHVNLADAARPTGPAVGDLTGDYPDPLIGDLKVTETKIADNAVTTGKIADAAVTSNKIADAAVTTNKIANAAVTSPKIATDAVRAAQLAATGQVTNNAGIAANGNASVSVQCPAGTQVINGGGTATSFGVHMVSTFQTGNGWIVAYQNTTAAAQTITVAAQCLAA